MHHKVPLRSFDVYLSLISINSKSYCNIYHAHCILTSLKRNNSETISRPVSSSIIKAFMETPSSSLACNSIQSVVNEIKKEVFSTQCLHDLVAPSPYDTAWLAMIPDPSNPDRPLFQSCLNWVLDNQNEEGFWGDYNGDEDNGIPTIDALPATLACLVALKKWNVGDDNILKGNLSLNFQYSDQSSTITEKFTTLNNIISMFFY